MKTAALQLHFPAVHTIAATMSHPTEMHSSTADPATVSSFKLDKYKVTVGRFRSIRPGKDVRLPYP